MSQTVVLFPVARAAALRGFLESCGFVSRAAKNAVFSAKGDGLTVTLFRSGKVLVQGRGAEAFASDRIASLAAGGAPAPETRERPAPPADTGLLIGTDEAGKGDYFGPLCVAGVALDAEGGDRLSSMGVRDGKTIADPTVLSLDSIIRAEYPFVVVALDPEEYNRRYAEEENLNRLLASLHALVIGELAGKTGAARALTDQFADPRVLICAVEKLGIVIDLRQRPRAETETAVAAASIVARAEFLRRLEALASVGGRRLPKGASDIVDSAAREIHRRGGRELLRRVAKLHFKTTGKATGLYP